MSIVDTELQAYGVQLSTSATEVELRASIGRSYYAAYHRSNDWHNALPSQGIAEPGMGLHATLISCLTRPTVVGQKKLQSMSIGYVLRVMKAARTRSDYDLKDTIDSGLAQTVAEQARQLLIKAV
jgi:hypothetical protein